MLLDTTTYHDGNTAWKYFPHYWSFVRESIGDSLHKRPVMQDLMFPMLLTWSTCWKNSLVAGDMRRHYAHATLVYNVVFGVNLLVFLPQAKYGWTNETILNHRLISLWCTTFNFRSYVWSFDDKNYFCSVAQTCRHSTCRLMFIFIRISPFGYRGVNKGLKGTEWLI